MSEEEDIGLETLQAQVDMSLAFTQNLVTSWLKPTEGKLPSSKASNEEKELEAYMRRPPRYADTCCLHEYCVRLRIAQVRRGRSDPRVDEPAQPGQRAAEEQAHLRREETRARGG